MRFARAVLVALLVLLIAVTPISALISPGEFEVRIRSPWPSFSALRTAAGFTVKLADRTGLVRGMAPAQPEGLDVATNLGADGKTIVVSWGHGCGAYRTDLVLERSATGFRLSERTHSWGCPLMILITHAVVLHLWGPVDAATVRFESVNENP